MGCNRAFIPLAMGRMVERAQRIDIRYWCRVGLLRPYGIVYREVVWRIEEIDDHVGAQQPDNIAALDAQRCARPCNPSPMGCTVRPPFKTHPHRDSLRAVGISPDRPEKSLFWVTITIDFP